MRRTPHILFKNNSKSSPGVFCDTIQLKTRLRARFLFRATAGGICCRSNFTFPSGHAGFLLSVRAYLVKTLPLWGRTEINEWLILVSSRQLDAKVILRVSRVFVNACRHSTLLFILYSRQFVKLQNKNLVRNLDSHL